MMKTEKLREFYEKYERYISPAALLAGFVWDNLTLSRIDLLYDNIVIITYLIIAAIAILLINVYEKIRGRFFEKVVIIMPFVLQFAFGGLFSAFVIFYFKSASLLTSWPFLLALAGLLIGNEVFRQRYSRLIFQMSIFFISVFSYSIFALPVLLNKMGDSIFIISGIISLLLISLFSWALFRFIPERLKPNRISLFSSIGSIYLVFNVLYFTNILPPIPLALQESGIYHQVQRVAGNKYQVLYEPAPWYLFFKDFNPVFHWVPGTPIYSYSSVFAPTEIKTTIVHRWSYFNQETGEWEIRNTLKYQMAGGRDGGYRGYSFKSNFSPGKWKVEVMTERGQVLGSSKFEVVEVKEKPELRTAFY